MNRVYELSVFDLPHALKFSKGEDLPHQGLAARITPLLHCKRGVAAKAAGVSVNANQLYAIKLLTDVMKCFTQLSGLL